MCVTPGNFESFAKSEKLCLSCKLCCQGLFFRHDNDPADYDLPESVGISDSELLFDSRCLLLGNSGCLIHKHPNRPQICRDYQCQLLKNYLNDSISLAQALQISNHITYLFSLFSEIVEGDRSKPVFYLLLDLWNAHKNDIKSTRVMSQNDLISLFSLIRTVNQYIFPSSTRKSCESV